MNGQNRQQPVELTIEVSKQNLENLINTVNLVHKDYELLIKCLNMLYEAAKQFRAE